MVAVLHLIPDCMCLAMIPQTSEVKGMLEELIPEEDIPEGGKFAAEVSHNCLFTYDQKDMIVSLFDDVSIAHEHLAPAAGTMSSLCKVLNPQQLLLVMKSSVCPLMQLNMTPGLFDPPTKKEWKDLPDDHTEHIHNTMIPDLEEKMFCKETHYNATRLLAATVTFYVDLSFGKSCTMKEVQENFIIHTKPLSLCITGYKYQGGSDRRSQLKRKRKSVPSEMATKDPDDSDDGDDGASTKKSHGMVEGQPK